MSGMQLRLNLCEIVFRNAENHRNRLKLRDDYQRGGAVRLNDVARIHQAKPDAPVDR